MKHLVIFSFLTLASFSASAQTDSATVVKIIESKMGMSFSRPSTKFTSNDCQVELSSGFSHYLFIKKFDAQTFSVQQESLQPYQCPTCSVIETSELTQIDCECLVPAEYGHTDVVSEHLLISQNTVTVNGLTCNFRN